MPTLDVFKLICFGMGCFLFVIGFVGALINVKANSDELKEALYKVSTSNFRWWLLAVLLEIAGRL